MLLWKTESASVGYAPLGPFHGSSHEMVHENVQHNKKQRTAGCDVLINGQVPGANAHFSFGSCISLPAGAKRALSLDTLIPGFLSRG